MEVVAVRKLECVKGVREDKGLVDVDTKEILFC
jgi:hypothetical protein